MWFNDFKKDNVSLEKLVKIQIPSTLRKQLVDDWEFVTQQDKVSLKCFSIQLKILPTKCWNTLPLFLLQGWLQIITFFG